MKKSILLLSSLFVMSGINTVFAQDDAQIEEIELQIEQKEQELSDLKSKLKELTGEADEEIIVDDEEFLIKFMEIKELDDRYEVEFEIENKSDQKIELQARTVSVDDTMVDDSILIMSQEVAPRKKATATLKFQNYSDPEDLPELTGNLELDLHIFSWDDYDFTRDYPVSISLD